MVSCSFAKKKKNIRTRTHTHTMALSGPIKGNSPGALIYDWTGDAPVYLSDVVWPDAPREGNGLHYQISWVHPYDEHPDPRGVNILTSTGSDLVVHATNDIWALNETECARTQSVLMVQNPLIFNLRLDVKSSSGDHNDGGNNWGPETTLRLGNNFKYAAICEDDGRQNHDREDGDDGDNDIAF